MQTNSSEQLAWLRLAFMPYIGPETFSALMAHYGNAQNVWAAQFEVGTLLPPQAAQAWRTRQHEAFTAADEALNWAQQKNCGLLTSQDADYPPMLKEGLTPPPVLFVRGDARLLCQAGVAIVGSRHATPQALRTAADFAAELAKNQLTVFSGMAAGIDTAAHEGALRVAGSTVAVWGTGIDRVYPKSNQNLAHQLAEQGCIISEFPLGTRPLAGNFPRRNRLIAALSHATLVVEATIESGSLITARLAGEMGREVLAIPGSIHNPQSKGCHALIKQGAKLVESVQDILEECPVLQDLIAQSAASSPQVAVSDVKKTKALSQTKTSSEPLSASSPLQVASSPLPDNPPTSSKPCEDSPLLRLMGYDAVHPDTLCEQLNLTAAELYAELMLLELEGRIVALAGGRYQRVSAQ